MVQLKLITMTTMNASDKATIFAPQPASGSCVLPKGGWLSKISFVVVDGSNVDVAVTVTVAYVDAVLP